MSNYPTVPTSNMSFQYPGGGLSSVTEYMASGLPYSTQVAPTTGSTVQVDFPMVTQELYIKNNSNSSVGIGWTSNGCLGSNRYTLEMSQSVNFKVRVRSLFVTVISGSTPANVDITAALTQIPSFKFPVLTGSLARADGYIGSFNSGSAIFGQNGYNGIG